MMKITDQIILKEAIKSWGIKAQTEMLIEECAELIQAISKYNRANDSDIQKRFENIAEEIADVEILLDQMRIIFKNDKLIEEYREMKIDRLYTRLNQPTP